MEMTALWKGAVLYVSAILCLTWLGGRFIALCLRGLSGAASGRPGGGQKIGYVERLLIFIFVLCGSIEAIGFLITAKSILRFSESSKDKQYAEYVLLGTLLSYLLALIVALATRYAQSSLGLVGVA